jgi:AAA domain (dynein-related subfamily)
MKVVIPVKEAAKFAKQITTDSYGKDERDYKVAVHRVLSALLSQENIGRDDFPSLVSNVFKEPLPDLGALGIAEQEQDVIKAACATQGAGALRSAMANLAGGKWGLAQFSWIPRAIEFGLGEPIAEAFRGLIDPAVPLPQRVESFRDQFDSIGLALEKKGGFLPNWRHFRESLSFVAMVLAGYDPNQYTFYSKGALRHGYERYAPEAAWPKGTMGEIYAAVCSFVQAVADELKEQGVPVQDLIDAQSFIWLSFGAAKKEVAEGGPKKPEAEPAPLPTPVVKKIDSAAVAKDLASAVLWPLERAQHLVALVQRWGQLLFQGPPGTGKTFVAETLARLLAGDEEGRVEVVQFHPSYAYEDFVEGIRPVVTEGSNLTYEVRKGIFMKLVDQAKEYPEDPFFLVVDELNRANLPRVLGELLYALEYRGPEHTFRLPYSAAETYIPSNITIIGTMNTADRSIALVDAAIRRRFRHVDFIPDPIVLKAWLGAHGLGAVADHAADRLVALNAQLGDLLDVDRLIGHTYLMRGDLGDVGLEAVWKEDIEPILREHLFNQPGEIVKLRDVFLAPP